MKKLLLGCLGLVSLFCLCGCEEEDYLGYLTTYHDGAKTLWGTRVKDPEPDNPYPLYVFPALKQGNPDFAVHLVNPWDFSNALEYDDAPGYSDRKIIASVYSLTCEDCYAQAPYFDRLAEEFKDTPLEFVALFMDNDPDAIAKLDYINNFRHVNVYYNSDDFCKNGLCVHSPNGVMVHGISQSKRIKGINFFPVPPDANRTPEEVYEHYVKLAKELLNGEKSENKESKPVDPRYVMFDKTIFHDGEQTPWGTVVDDPESSNPYPLYVVPALNPTKPDFALHLQETNGFKSKPGYSDRIVVTAIYPAEDCKSCQAHAPYFERLAREFADTNVEFAILFRTNNPETLRQTGWIRNIKDVNVYYAANTLANQLSPFNDTDHRVWIAQSEADRYSYTNFPTPDRENFEQEAEKHYYRDVEKTQEVLRYGIESANSGYEWRTEDYEF